jgi:SAM-dependent methyltransferase
MLFRPADGSCNICGGGAFAPGPGGRLAATGKPPRCEGCDALERHRALRRLMERLPAAALSWRRGLQFSRDPSLRPEWFRSWEVSVYNGENSLDLTHLDRADASYDFVSLNMVLEFIPDARTAFAELMRILSPDGILQAGFSHAEGREATLDYPAEQGDYGKGQGYFHLFGRDLADYFELKRHGASFVVLSESDAATGVATEFHFFARGGGATALLAATVRQTRALMNEA